MQELYRFLVGGVVVSLFAALGDALRPKSFAGILGAAPSVALATLALTAHTDGAGYAAVEARSMIIGAAALLIYAWACCRTMWRGKISSAAATLSLLTLWALCAFAGWFFVLRGRT